MDLSKLTPAPWEVRHDAELDAPYLVISPENWLMAEYDRADGGGKEALEFAALARNAFDVMVRRNWYCVPSGGHSVLKWRVREDRGYDLPLRFTVETGGYFPDPFTALIEADKWCAANVDPK